MKTIVKMKFGSHLYGTNTPTSDLDWKMVHIPSAKDILLQRAKDVYSSQTKADNSAKNGADDIDSESYSLQKFLKLVTEGQTVALDMLFSTSWTWYYQGNGYDKIWRTIQDNKHRLLSKKYMSFVGYCRTQANKYGIKGSRMAAAKAAMDFFEKCLYVKPHAKVVDFSLAVNEYLYGVEHISILPTVGDLKYDFILDVCGRKCQYGNSLKNAYDMYKRLYDEYGQRAKDAMNNENIDWKALSHAVRIGEQAVELLTTGNVVFPRPNASDLLQIKRGIIPYSTVADKIEHLLVQIEDEAAKSSLPAEPDYEWVEQLIYETYKNEIISNS